MVGQHVADRAQISDLRCEHGKIGGNAFLDGAACRDAIRAHRGELRQVLAQAFEDRRRVPCDGDVGRANPFHLGRIDIDLHDRELVVHSPGIDRELEPRPDRQHHVSLGPQRVPAGQYVAERMTLVEHALAAAISNNGSGEAFGERANLDGCVVGAAAYEDHGMVGFGEQIGGPADGILVERRLRQG